MEVMNVIWQYIAPIFGGISIGGIVAAILYGCLKGAFNKTIAKINVEKISEKATEQGIEKVKQISFTQSIQPIVESELKKITEQANLYIKTALEQTQEKYDKLVSVLEKLSAYFDNSIGVPEQAKEELKQALENAKNDTVEPQTIKVEEIVEQTVSADLDPKETAKKSVKVDR